jgi:hypothetical protein
LPSFAVRVTVTNDFAVVGVPEIVATPPLLVNAMPAGSVEDVITAFSSLTATITESNVPTLHDCEVGGTVKAIDVRVKY